ncbi:hypothetical protein F4810DRAFT_711222 [Camillea tinctor]|nr:hypothetical protein F4810DRAFT_711222 [Camillea tinctor]
MQLTQAWKRGDLQVFLVMATLAIIYSTLATCLIPAIRSIPLSFQFSLSHWGLEQFRNFNTGILLQLLLPRTVPQGLPLKLAHTALHVLVYAAVHLTRPQAAGEAIVMSTGRPAYGKILAAWGAFHAVLTCIALTCPQDAVVGLMVYTLTLSGNILGALPIAEMVIDVYYRRQVARYIR